LATRSRAELAILHVLSPLGVYAVPELSGVAWDQLERESRAAAQAKLTRLTHHVKARLPRTRVQGLLAEGNPATEILRAAKRLKCDVILIATHGHSGLVHLLMGGVAERVVRTAPCPVLTVRHPAMRVKAT
jgi:nucleotide-binding universal stress UspA family protein